MFKLPEKLKLEFENIYKTHCVQNAAQNVFYHNIRLINNRHLIVNRDFFSAYIKGVISNIELVSSPIDSFLFDNEENNNDEKFDNIDSNIENGEKEERLFRINRECPEYKQIRERLPFDTLINILPPADDLTMLIKERRDKEDIVYDDIYMYYCLFKYLEKIETIRNDQFINDGLIIEWVINNIDLKELKNYIYTKKVNQAKYESKCADIVFNPDIANVYKFYNVEDDTTIPSIDVVNLLKILCSNTIVKSDIYIIMAIYDILILSMNDYLISKDKDTVYIKFVEDVLSKI